MQRTPNNGRKLKLSGNNGVKARQQQKRDVSSTPIVSHRLDSPSFGEVSPSYDTWDPSPVRFMSTQDGSYGENDVIWNYYSPKSDKELQHLNTPIRRKRTKRNIDEFSPISRLPTKRKLKHPPSKNLDYLQGLKEELLAINKDIQGKISTKKNEDVLKDVNIVNNSPISRRNSDDMFDESPVNALSRNTSLTRENSPVVLKHLAIRNNICDKIKKCENEGIESDDSMNECLLMASQMVEEVIKTDNLRTNKLLFAPKRNLTIKIESPKLKNDSFDNLMSNINEFDIEVLSQATATKDTKLNTPQRSLTLSSLRSNKLLKNSVNTSNRYHVNANPIDNVHDYKFNEDETKFHSGSSSSAKENNDGCNMNDISDITKLLNSSALNESKLRFGRHNSMPESPREPKCKKVKTGTPSGFIRHSTMPASHQHMQGSEYGGSSPPMRCTQDEIMKKRQAAKEKLLARRNGPQSSRINLPPSNINNLLNINLPHQSMTHNKMPSKSLSDTNNLQKYSDRTQSIQKTNSDSNIKSHVQVSNNQNGNVSNFKYKPPKGNTLLKEINIHEEIERKRREALQKLQMKRAQFQTNLK